MSVTFTAQERVDFGSQVAKNARKSGNIPAIIYGKPSNINLLIEAKSFEKEYLKGNLRATVVEIVYGNKKIKAIAHDITLDPVTDRPIHIDFINCDKVDFIRAKPKFNFKGKEKSPGLKRGGFLHVALRRTEILCDAKAEVPTEIDIAIDALHISDKVRSKDVKLPEGVKFANKNDFLICSITGRGKSTEDNAANAAADANKEGQSSENSSNK